jgi:heptosyltransferase-2
VKVLIVRLNAIGDIVMTLPLLEVLRSRYPAAQVTYVCGETVASIPRLLDRVEVIAVDDRALLMGTFSEKVRALIDVWRRLFGRRFDLVLTLHFDWRFLLLSATALARERRRLNRSRGRRLPVPGRYDGAEYIRLLTEIDGPDAPPARLPELNLTLPNSLRQLFKNCTTPLVALAPGGAKNLVNDSPLRRWPLESYARLARELCRVGYRVAITGASSDAWVGTAFRHLEVIDLIGQTSLVDLLALYQHCSAVVTHDSGPLHFALLARVPTIALFGPISPHERVLAQPWLRVIWGGAGLVCRPCFDGRHYAPCSNNRCMTEIDVELVAEAVEELVVKFPRQSIEMEKQAQNS